MYRSFNPLDLLLPLLFLQQARCVHQPPSNHIDDPHCSNDVESWGTIDHSVDCTQAITDMQEKDPLIKKPPGFFEYLSSKGKPVMRIPRMQTPRRYTSGQQRSDLSCAEMVV